MLTNFRTYHLAVTFYRNCALLKLPHHLKDQLSRASSSVALNLAEGRGKSSLKEQRKFFEIAFASLRESQSILDIGNVSGEVVEVSDHLAASLYKLMKTIVV